MLKPILSRVPERYLHTQNLTWTPSWGGWLRAADTFYLDDKDVEIIMPTNGGIHNFPIEVGSVLLTLGPDTKGQHFKRGGVPLAETFASGTTPHYSYLQLMKYKEELG
jgi:hypothetical protein